MTSESLQHHQHVTRALAELVHSPTTTRMMMLKLCFSFLDPEAVAEAARRIHRTDRCGPRVRYAEDLRKRVSGRTSAISGSGWGG